MIMFSSKDHYEKYQHFPSLLASTASCIRGKVAKCKSNFHVFTLQMSEHILCNVYVITSLDLFTDMGINVDFKPLIHYIKSSNIFLSPFHLFCIIQIQSVKFQIQKCPIVNERKLKRWSTSKNLIDFYD